MWILQLLHDSDIIQFNIEILIHALERPTDRDVVLELNRHFAVDQSLEEAAEKHKVLAIARDGENCSL